MLFTHELSKAVQRRLDKENYLIGSLKDFSQVLAIYQTFKKRYFIRSSEVTSEDELLTDILRQCDHNALWENKEIIKQMVTRIKFLREKCNI